jgi:SNF2 family DNA or RNA helicase
MVLDEAQAVKNSASQRWKTLLVLSLLALLVQKYKH